MKNVSKIISLCSILFLLIGCSESKVRIENLEGEVDKFMFRGELITDKEGRLFNGNIFSEYESGNLKSEVKVVKGIPTGDFISYYENGNPKNKKTFKNGKLCCREEVFFENGQLKGFSNYNQDGKFDGVIELYYENGRKESSGGFVNGKQNGLWEKYYENGQLFERGQFQNGEKIGKWEVYDFEGNESSYLELLEKKLE